MPAYLSNGLIGLRVPDVPLLSGYALVNGFIGEHPDKHIEAAARAPFPLGGEIKLNDVAMSGAAHSISNLEQSYDFASGELTTRLSFVADGARAEIEVLIFCSRSEPCMVCQKVQVQVDRACKLTISAGIWMEGVGGRAHVLRKDVEGHEQPIDGLVRWSGLGELSTCGLAYATCINTPAKAERSTAANPEALNTSYVIQAKAGQKHELTQFSAIVPSVLHKQPEMQAVRLLAKSLRDGFSYLRARNREEWDELWKSRTVLRGADRNWQARADAAFFYLNTSVHSSSHGSTSMFGLATWKDYHYYYGHVMWDIETFVIPVLSVVQPHAAAALLEFRFRSLAGALNNARTGGYRGLQFPWESSPMTGEEAAPLPGSAAWYEHHVTLDVALAFVFHARVTGDQEFLESRAWPVVSGVAGWLESRVIQTSRGYTFNQSMGIAERQQPVDNSAFTNIAATQVLRAAIEIGTTLGEIVKPIWSEIAEKLVIPMDGNAIVSYEGYSPDHEKSETPDPLAALFPLGYQMPTETERATLAMYLSKADDYIGSPMLSALFGVWAAWSGDRPLALILLEEGYAAFLYDRFTQTLEYRRDRFPNQPAAGPFMANIGGFLMSLLFGFPAILPEFDKPERWSRRPVMLPEGWEAIEVQRVWIRGKPTRISAQQGDVQARLEILEVP